MVRGEIPRRVPNQCSMKHRRLICNFFGGQFVKSKPRGRPYLASDKKRTIRLNIRLTKLERDSIREAAEARQMSEAEYVRFMAVR